MKNPPLNVGVLTPPDAHYRPKLYSHSKATKDFNKINSDVYEGQKKAKRFDERKTPKSVFWALGLGALALLYPLAKKLFRG